MDISRAQGVARGEAVGAHLDVGLGSNIAAPGGIVGSDDEYNSHSSARVIPCRSSDEFCDDFPNVNTSSIDIWEHLGLAHNGIALFADVTGAAVGAAPIGIGSSNDDYDRSNVAPIKGVSVLDGFGHARSGYAFFLELMGADNYVVGNTASLACGGLMGDGGGTVLWPVLGPLPSEAWYRDWGGSDPYDPCTPGSNGGS